MTQRILYNDDDNNLVIIVPSPEFLTEFSIGQVALKDVPTGKSYKIVEVTDIPEDRTFRNAWEVDNTILTDGVGADYGIGSDLAVIAWDENKQPILKEIK